MKTTEFRNNRMLCYVGYTVKYQTQQLSLSEEVISYLLVFFLNDDNSADQLVHQNCSELFKIR